MLKYLIENKEWIFSGIGIFLLACGVSLLKFILDRKKANNLNKGVVTKEKVHFEKEEVNADTNAHEISDITVKTIIDEIHSAPPFQQDSVSKNYIDLKVRWEGKLWSVEKDRSLKKGEQIVRVEFHPVAEDLHYSVLLNVNINQYPELRIAKRGSIIAAEGKIIHCSNQGMYVEITPSKLHFYSKRDFT